MHSVVAIIRRVPMKLSIAAAAAMAVTVLASAVPVPAPAADSDQPDASAVFTTETVALGVRYTWGSGVLKFHGHRYPFKIEGLGVVGAGVNKVHGVAQIYHLRSAADFAGTYAKAAAGGSFGKDGGESSTMKNGRGGNRHPAEPWRRRRPHQDDASIGNFRS
jgi:hypothetical protein